MAKAPQKGPLALTQIENKTYRTSKDWTDLASHMRQAEQATAVTAVTYTGTTTAACYASAADILSRVDLAERKPLDISYGQP